MAAHLHFREFIRAYQQTSTLLTTTIVLEYTYSLFVLTARTLVRVPTFMHWIPVSEDLEKRIHILYLIFPHNYSIHTFSNNCCCCSLSSFDSNPILCIDGDGWQGAEISISTCDGTEVLAATTLSCAYGDYFCVDDFGAQDVVVTVTDDYYSSEVEWELFTPTVERFKGTIVNMHPQQMAQSLLVLFMTALLFLLIRLRLLLLWRLRFLLLWRLWFLLL